MKNSTNKILRRVIFIALAMVTLWGCTVDLSFSGASISPDVKTIRVDYFPNMAAMVAPILSPTLTDELKAKIQRETRLEFVTGDADVTLEGEIVDYRSEPIAITGDEYAAMNRLTIAVRVRFTNNKEPHLSYNRSFTAYADFNSSQMLTSIESSLIPEITEKLIDDIFNAAFSNW